MEILGTFLNFNLFRYLPRRKNCQATKYTYAVYGVNLIYKNTAKKSFVESKSGVLELKE